MQKALLIFLCLCASTVGVLAQECCHKTLYEQPAPDEFAMLASDKAFVLSHALPLPFKFRSEAGGEMMTFQTYDGKQANGFLIKAKKKSHKYLFVYQEWWGLNDYIKREAEKYYNEFDGKVNVLAIDMYDGNVATTREDAVKYMQGATPERLEAIMKGATIYAGSKARIASVGWCFGGGLSLKSAIIEGSQAVGCVIYYGMPIKDVEKLKTLQCDVLGIFAGKEKNINPQVVATFDENMKAANKQLTFKIFDAEHAFANPSNPNFDKTATEEAYKMSSEYLKKRLGI
jgi:carboxymethylenebutenolidase